MVYDSLMFLFDADTVVTAVLCCLCFVFSVIAVFLCVLCCVLA